MAPNSSVIPEQCTTTSHLWIFGYGSLLWKPNFEYSSREIGHVKGYVRRFWQGNETHRGVPGKPGRVVTLVRKKEGSAWGMAFLLKGEKQILEALGHLNARECRLGGYTVYSTTFYARGGTHRDNVVVFTATPSCKHYMGPATMETIANQIVHSHGVSGHNLEYLFRLADAVREFIPEDNDEHLFGLEEKARRLLHALHRRTSSQEEFLHPGGLTKENNIISLRTSQDSSL